MLYAREYRDSVMSRFKPRPKREFSLSSQDPDTEYEISDFSNVGTHQKMGLFLTHAGCNVFHSVAESSHG